MRRLLFGVQSTVEGGVVPEREAAGHIEMLSSLSPFSMPRTTSCGMVPYTRKVGLLSQPNLNDPLRTCPEICSHGDSNSHQTDKTHPHACE